MPIPIGTHCFSTFEITRFDTIDSFDHVNYKLVEKLKSKSIIVACLYPNSSEVDIPEEELVRIIPSICSPKELESLKKDKDTFLIFDFSREGFSYQVFNFFKYLTVSGIANNIPSEKIIYITGNLLDEETYEQWNLKNYPDYKIKVLSVNLWDSMLLGLFRWKKHGRPHTLEQTKIEIEKGQYNFLNLNRRHRPFRDYTAFKLWNSTIQDHLMLSCDEINGQTLYTIEKWCLKNQIEFNNKSWKKFSKQTPFVLDRHDFETNWADTLPQDLFDRSLISLISETLSDSHNNTSLFYSEKSFKPMWYNHPILIFGQRRANTYLEKIGYALYDDYFDLSFDTIENDAERCNRAVNEVEKVYMTLKNLTPSQKYDWLMQGEKTLKHNKDAILEQTYNNQKLRELIKYIETGN